MKNSTREDLAFLMIRLNWMIQQEEINRLHKLNRRHYNKFPALTSAEMKSAKRIYSRLSIVCNQKDTKQKEMSGSRWDEI